MRIFNNKINQIDVKDGQPFLKTQSEKSSGGSASSYKEDSLNINKPKRNDDILFVGMNKDAGYEIKKLRENILKSNDQIKVLAVTDSGFSTLTYDNGKKVKSITVKDNSGNSYNLLNRQEIKNYVKTFGLPEDQSEKIVNAINTFDPKARDEIANIAKIWVTAEKGGDIPSRLLMSGHSTGNGIFGDDNGEISFDSLDKLANAMPKAASKVEDLHIAGCYAGGQHTMYKYTQIFPNLKTVWAYTNSAPGASSGAESHQKIWEKATRGETDSLERNLANKTRKGDSVAVWSVGKGYNDGKPPRSFNDVMSNIAKTQENFDAYFSGDEEVADPYSNNLRDFYDDLQDLIQHPDLPSDKRQGLEDLKEQTIRLIFFERIENNFSKTYKDQVNQSFKELGLTATNFRDLSRKEAMDKINDFEEKYKQVTNPSKELQETYKLLTLGLRELDSSIIPQSWI